jgi:hypothetical protein
MKKQLVILTGLTAMWLAVPALVRAADAVDLAYNNLIEHGDLSEYDTAKFPVMDERQCVSQRRQVIQV